MTTEERIKAAARKVFHQKGYAGTRTRDIAEEAASTMLCLTIIFVAKKSSFKW